MRNELIKINYEGEQATVSARELHTVLGATERFSNWFDRQLQYGFQEATDYIGCKEFNALAKQELQDYKLSINAAKEICMVQRSEKGKQYRQYFLDLEKAWNMPDQVIARALKMADVRIQDLQTNNSFLLERNDFLGWQIEEQQKVISEQQPKVNYVDTILTSKSLVVTTQIAKDYGMSARAFNKVLNELGVQYKMNGQWLLYAKYQGDGYVHSSTILITRSNGRQEPKMSTEWTQKGRLFLYEELKRHDIIPIIEMEKQTA